MLDLSCSIVNRIFQVFWNIQLFCMGLSVPLENGLVPCIQGQDIQAQELFTFVGVAEALWFDLGADALRDHIYRSIRVALDAVGYVAEQARLPIGRVFTMLQDLFLAGPADLSAYSRCGEFAPSIFGLA